MKSSVKSAKFLLQQTRDVTTKGQKAMQLKGRKAGNYLY